MQIMVRFIKRVATSWCIHWIPHCYLNVDLYRVWVKVHSRPVRSFLTQTIAQYPTHREGECRHNQRPCRDSHRRCAGGDCLRPFATTLLWEQRWVKFVGGGVSLPCLLYSRGYVVRYTHFTIRTGTTASLFIGVSIDYISFNSILPVTTITLHHSTVQ